MCFSAGVSFTSAAVLVPMGLLCFNKTVRTSDPHWVFTLLPLMFGIQQAFEGGVWQSLDTGNADILRLAALCFLFFSHFFWLAWIPFCCYLTETSHTKKRGLLFTSVAGALLGVTLFVPFLLHPSWLTVSILNHSVVYHTTLIYDEFISRNTLTAVYTMVVIIPLLLSDNSFHKRLGGLILFSMAASLTLYSYAFISVWCFFSAIISFYICYVILIGTKPANHPAPVT